ATGLRPDGLEGHRQFPIAQRPCWWQRGGDGVVGGGGNRQLPADRLDSPTLLVGGDEAHDFGSRGSSSRAKKAEAAFRISLARRSSRFSRSRLRIRSCSVLVMPGRLPPSISARRTQWRSVSGLVPNFSASELRAAHSDGYSLRWSKTIRTARSCNSWGYRLDRAKTPSSQGLESPHYPGRFNVL